MLFLVREEREERKKTISYLAFAFFASFALFALFALFADNISYLCLSAFICGLILLPSQGDIGES